jgi:hypothetical protein
MKTALHYLIYAIMATAVVFYASTLPLEDEVEEAE